ncbi:MAG TPA: hypothetical protein VJ915_06900 [Balneolaceae bacterium]|nr:hypothetical protein [Balneolaceae bacterium]
MTTKQNLIKKIEQINDPDLLNELDRWVSSLMELSDAESFSKEEISAVKEGYQQYLDGKTVTHTEANSLFDEWLKEK